MEGDRTMKEKTYLSMLGEFFQSFSVRQRHFSFFLCRRKKKELKDRISRYSIMVVS